MKRRLKLVSTVLLAVMLISVAVSGQTIGPFGVDVVSAASEAWEETPAPAPTPAPMPEPAQKETPTPVKSSTSSTPAVFGGRLLVVGSFGEDVKLLQAKLNEEGNNLVVDGFFGKQTKNAVMSFQSKNGLIADGIVGSKTYAKLNLEPVQVVPAVPEVVPAEPVVDAVTAPSVVSDEATLLNSISANGSWIPYLLNDVTTDKELVVEGDFYKKNLVENGLYRKLAFYSQDDDHNITARFTLNAPKLTIMSPNTTLQAGTFVGDVYVRAAGFNLAKEAKIDGDVYFVTQEAKDTFTMDEGTVITGNQILADVDAVSTASIVNNEDAFVNAISEDGSWIVCPLTDLNIDKDLVVAGEFYKKNLQENGIYRKIGLYTHNDPSDKKIVTHRFTLTAPTMTIKSENTSLQHGIFVGDIYVAAPGFGLADQAVEGNIYFVTQEAMDTFTMDEASSVTGDQVLLDAVTGASIVSDEATLLNSIKADGSWIPYLLNDVTTDKELVVEGTFYKKNLPENGMYRKLAFYAQDDAHKITARYSLTAPKLTIKSENTTLQAGTFVGDVYVRAAGFNLAKEAKIDGDVYFVTQEAKDTFSMEEGTVITGSQILADVDAVSTASIVDNGEDFVKAISKDGAWIICPLTDLNIDEDLVVEGEFHKKNDNTQDIYRKIGLYTHNDPSDKKIVTHRFTLTAPSMTIKSENVSLQHGIFVGDIYVEATGFNLADQVVEGNIYFATQEAMDSFAMDEASSVTGVQELK